MKGPYTRFNNGLPLLGQQVGGDNAKQPMQAAPVAVIRNLVSSSKSSKLLICFSHFDMVAGDNLRGCQSKEQHVFASAENALTVIGSELGPFAGRALRKRLTSGCFLSEGLTSSSRSRKNEASERSSEMPQIFDALADAISTRILDIAERRIGQERVQTWKNALNKSGRGSTFVRAAIIADDVHAQATPVPTVAPPPDRNRFLHEVIAAVEAAAAEQKHHLAVGA
jgi:hypothetical protein